MTSVPPSGVQAVKTNLGRVSRNESEAIHVSLRKADGRQYVELRVYSRSKRHGRVSLPAREAIAVPVVERCPFGSDWK